MKTDLNKLNKITFTLVALMGILVCVELLTVYYNANFNPDAGASFCSVNEHIDCDGVAKTIFSRFLEIPLALWGLGFYSFILFLSLFPFEKYELFNEFKHPRSYIFTLATFSVLLSLGLYYISHYVIEKVCILCQTLYLTNVTFFIASKLGNSYIELFKNTFVDVKNILSDKNWQKIAGVLFLAGAIVLTLINVFKPFTPKKVVPKINVSKYYEIGKIGNTLGDKDAKFVLHEYTDYECPFCEISHGMMLRLSKEVEGVRIEHHDFPLNSNCNKLVQGSAHVNSCKAIYYAKAARKQGKFWDLATLLYNNRKNLSEKNILKLAESIDLDIKQLKKDAKNISEYQKEIDKDVNRAKGLGINGTPSYIFGIKKHEGIMPYKELKQKVLENL